MGKHTHTLIAILLASTINHVIGLTAYDCAGPQLNFSTIQLTNPEICHSLPMEPHIESTQIQVLQATDIIYEKIIQCKIKIYRIIFHCGENSHLAAAVDGSAEYNKELTRDWCVQAHENTNSDILGLTNLKSNNTYSKPITLAGYIGRTGQCQEESYQDPYGKWDNVVVQAQIILSLSDYILPIKMNSNEVTLKSGKNCIYANGSCTDINGENTFWKVRKFEKCEIPKYTSMYMGPAEKLKMNIPGKLEQQIFPISVENFTLTFNYK